MTFTASRRLFNAVRGHTGWRLATVISMIVFPLTIVTNLRRHRDVAGILDLPTFAIIAKLQPRFPFKYLNRRYLAKGLTGSGRALALIHHYRYLSVKLREGFLRSILDGGVNIYETTVDDSTYAVRMTLSGPITDEGELSLELCIDGASIFTLSFTIVPGLIVGVPAEDALMISRIQGVKGVFELIHKATKALHETSPPALLFSAVNGVALAFGIDHIAGVCAASQPSHSEVEAESFRTAYDEFFASVGGRVNMTGYYCFLTPIRGKHIASVRCDRRSRARKKRRFKASISESVRHALSAELSVPTHRP
jgi:uncharacterized protein VirK/YbjX